DLDLPPEWTGPLQLRSYRIGTRGGHVYKSRVFYVRQADAVRVQARPDRKEYRPGGQARVEFLLKDRDGKPSPGALSVTAVDEAIYQVNSKGMTAGESFVPLGRDL